jgi:hypothetical protein
VGPELFTCLFVYWHDVTGSVHADRKRRSAVVGECLLEWRCERREARQWFTDDRSIREKPRRAARMTDWGLPYTDPRRGTTSWSRSSGLVGPCVDARPKIIGHPQDHHEGPWQ